MNRPVPFLDLGRSHAELREEFDAAWARTIENSAFIGGEEVDHFESAWAQYCGTRYCIGASDGTAALELALAAVGIGPGDDVVVPANTFIATVEAVVKLGARPVFADVDPSTLLLTVAEIEAVLTPHTVAVIAVHLYGQPCDMDAITELAVRRGLVVIEDAAQAHGATWRGRKVGSFGIAGCFSFYPAKNLGAIGDAGAVVTDDPALARAMRSRANHGRVPGAAERCDVLDGNHRLDALQAAILSIKLSHLDRWNAMRRNIMAHYQAALRGTDAILPTIQDEAVSSFHLAVILLSDRDAVRQRLLQAGINTAVQYPIPCHRQRGCDFLPSPSLPVVESAADRVLSLPLFPHMTEAEMTRVTDALTTILADREHASLEGAG